MENQNQNEGSTFNENALQQEQNQAPQPNSPQPSGDSPEKSGGSMYWWLLLVVLLIVGLGFIFMRGQLGDFLGAVLPEEEYTFIDGSESQAGTFITINETIDGNGVVNPSSDPVDVVYDIKLTPNAADDALYTDISADITTTSGTETVTAPDASCTGGSPCTAVVSSSLAPGEEVVSVTVHATVDPDALKHVEMQATEECVPYDESVISSAFGLLYTDAIGVPANKTVNIVMNQGTPDETFIASGIPPFSDSGGGTLCGIGGDPCAPWGFDFSLPLAGMEPGVINTLTVGRSGGGTLTGGTFLGAISNAALRLEYPATHVSYLPTDPTGSGDSGFSPSYPVGSVASGFAGGASLSFFVPGDGVDPLTLKPCLNETVTVPVDVTSTTAHSVSVTGTATTAPGTVIINAIHTFDPTEVALGEETTGTIELMNVGNIDATGDNAVTLVGPFVDEGGDLVITDPSGAKLKLISLDVTGSDYTGDARSLTIDNIPEDVTVTVSYVLEAIADAAGSVDVDVNWGLNYESSLFAEAARIIQVAQAAVISDTISGSVTVSPAAAVPACDDGIDNDGDGDIDSLDFGCTDPTDDDESDECSCPEGYFVFDDGTGPVCHKINFGSAGVVAPVTHSAWGSHQNAYAVWIKEGGSFRMLASTTMVLEAYVHFPTSKSYTFTYSVDNKGSVIVDDSVILSLPKATSSFTSSKSTSIFLEKGYHKVRLESVNTVGCVPFSCNPGGVALNIPGVGNTRTIDWHLRGTECPAPGEYYNTANTCVVGSVALECSAPIPACSDGTDNDGDGLTDFPDDPGCTDASDDDETDPTLPACSDGVDNDGDSFTDFPDDPGCSDADDDDETDSSLVCDDGVDNDSDGKTDFPLDPGCESPTDSDETDEGCFPIIYDASLGTSPSAQGWDITSGGSVGISPVTTEGDIDFVTITDSDTAGSIFMSVDKSDLDDKDWRWDALIRVKSSATNQPDTSKVAADLGVNMMIADHPGTTDDIYSSIYISTSKFGNVGVSPPDSYFTSVDFDTTKAFNVFSIDYHKNGPGKADDTYDILLNGEVKIADIARSDNYNPPGGEVSYIGLGVGSTLGTAEFDLAYTRWYETDCTPPPACSDGVDNDGDGLIDLADPGCSDPTDDDETDLPPVGACTPPPPGLIGWWHGDSASDDTVDSNDATLMGGAAYAPGKVLDGFSLDGSDDYVEVPEAGLELDAHRADFAPMTAITIDAWINRDTSTGDSVIVSKYDETVTSGKSYYFKVLADGRLEFGVFSGASEGRILITDSPVIPLDTFKHVAAVWEGGDAMFIAVDGAIVPMSFTKTASPAPTMNVNDVPVNFGRMTLSSGPAEFFDGIIDEVEIFDRPLSIAEIKDLYDADTFGKCKGLTPECSNGPDSDGDGLADLADPGCLGDPDRDIEKDPDGPACDNGIDDDGDGKFDFGGGNTDDPDCDSPTDDSESGPTPACSDGIDNDGDGLTDFPEDPGCSDADDDTETDPDGPECDNGLDDDSDGAADFKIDGSGDPHCDSVTDDSEAPECSNTKDDDGDGLSDEDDPNCHTDGDPDDGDDSYDPDDDSEAPECSNTKDDDGDGVSDEDDPECHTDGDPDDGDDSYDPDDDNEGPDVPECSDGIDNDGDGFIDFSTTGPSDPNCDDADDDSEAPECSDDADNDGDGLSDEDDPNCHTDGDPDDGDDTYNPDDDSETPQCSDTEDNDADGVSDSADSECHTDGDPTNPDSYDPTDDVEGTVVLKVSGPTIVERGTEADYPMSLTTTTRPLTFDLIAKILGIDGLLSGFESIIFATP